MKKQNNIETGIIDFKEIKNGDKFEDLILELFKNREGVLHAEQTGKGNDLEADILVKVERPNPLLETKKELIAVIQCKHFAHSNRSVTKGNVNIHDAIVAHHANIYLLVTSTRVGPYYTNIIKEINKDLSYKDVHAGYWNCNDLEKCLLEENNESIFRRFFPKSYINYAKLMKLKGEDYKARYNKVFKKTKGNMFSKDDYPFSKREGKKMQTVYLIRSGIDYQSLQELSLKNNAQKMGIEIKTSEDVEEEWLWSFEEHYHYDKFIEEADAAFAIVTKKGMKSPKVWLEIEKAMTKNKLKIIFIDEKCYTINLLGKYPCVLLKRNLKNSIADLENFYRTVFQSWGDEADYWFWFSTHILLSIFDINKINHN